MRLYLFLILLLSSGKFSDAFLGEQSLFGQDLFQLGILITHIFYLLVYNPRLRIGLKKNDKTTRALFILLFFLSISMFWSVSIEKTIVKAFFLVISFFSFSSYLNKRGFDKFFQDLIFSLVLILGINLFTCIVMPRIGISTPFHPNAWNGIYVQKNHLGRFASFSFLVSLIVLSNKKYVNSQIFKLSTINFVLSLLLLILSESKTGILISILLFVVFLLINVAVIRNLVLPRIYIIFIFLFIFIIIYINYQLTHITKMDLDSEDSLTGRIPIWIASVDVIRNDWVGGFGYGAFWQGYQFPSKFIYDRISWEPKDSHNGFIDIILDLGIVGLFLFLNLFLKILSHRLVLFKDKILYRSKKIQFHLVFIFVQFFFLYNITESAMLRPTNFFWYILIFLITLNPTVNTYESKNN